MTAPLVAGGEELTGEVRGVVFADTSTGFGVVEVETSGDGARCAGPLASLVEGEVVRLVGRWTAHERYGPTFEAVYYEQVTPTTVAGLRAFLTTERFDGLADEVRERVLAVFGASTGRVIEREPGRLSSEAALTEEDVALLRDGWAASRALADLVALVEPAGWPMDVVRAVHAALGADAPATAREDPYALLEVPRLRFGHADALARRLGIDATDPRRLAAGARAAVVAARRADGHQHLPRAAAVDATAQLLRLDRLLAVEGLDAAIADGVLAAEELSPGDEPIVAPPAALAAERDLAEALRQRVASGSSRLAGFADEVGVGGAGTAGQLAAVREAFASPVSLLVGGPGTGKTHAVARIVAAAVERGLDVALAAPTGRAAKRLEEVVSRPATTIHRLLQAHPTGDGFRFRYGPDTPLPHDLVVVDEVSMCDTVLAGHIVTAVDEGSHLVLVGDPDQLPSVGPGDVLRDLTRAGVVPVTRLTEVHRQAAESRIVEVAREILEGRLGPLSGADGDVFLAEEAVSSRIVPRVVEAVARRAPERLGVGVDEIQVLAPMYRGPAGVDALNTALRAELNPPAGRPHVGGFRVGDRVMQTRNDPEQDLANGDVGVVVDVELRAGRLRVGFPRGEVTVSSTRDLAPAWAVTVHKSQGGEWPVVVLVVDRSHRPMLWRNLVYTAVTRAQQALIIVGQHGALVAAAAHDRPSRRHTGLVARLTGTVVADPAGGDVVVGDAPTPR